jgi:hypothetical protein
MCRLLSNYPVRNSAFISQKAKNTKLVGSGTMGPRLILAFFSLVLLVGCSRMASKKPELFRRQPEYDLTRGPVRLRIFADNYQFLLFDPSKDPFDSPSPWDEAASKRGWTRNSQALWIGTRAHGNDHRVDLRLATRYMRDASAERETVHNMRFANGRLAIFEHPNDINFRLPAGEYKLYCRAYNLGNERPLSTSIPSDDEFFNHDEWERYEVILVPGVASKEGEL